jgi:ATP-dependent RNA helicase SUPV3L1/SUV3
VDAPHEAFEMDPRGRVHAQGVLLGRLVRGSNLAAPNVELAPLEELGAGVRLRLQRRLLAFARDSVSRTLRALDPLRHSEQPALRAIAYQLERGLGTASARELRGSLEILDDAARHALARADVVVGELAVFLPDLLRRGALEHRATLVAIFEPQQGLPPLGKTSYETRTLSASTWRSLGYIELGPRACRVDLAERAALALTRGDSDREALRCLSIPRRDAPGVARALREHLPPSAHVA